MNAIESVQAVRHATDMVALWSTDTVREVEALMPLVARARGHATLDWLVTVELFAKPGEDRAEAAQRLCRYMTLHGERFHKTPTLATIQQAIQGNR